MHQGFHFMTNVVIMKYFMIMTSVTIKIIKSLMHASRLFMDMQ